MAYVSCVSPTLFQPVESGSHLYSAHRNTMRSGLGESVLLALVGFPVWDCRSLAFCTFSIAYFGEFVNTCIISSHNCLKTNAPHFFVHCVQFSFLRMPKKRGKAFSTLRHQSSLEKRLRGCRGRNFSRKALCLKYG